MEARKLNRILKEMPNVQVAFQDVNGGLKKVNSVEFDEWKNIIILKPARLKKDVTNENDK